MIERDPIDWDMTGKPIYESIPKPIEIAMQESIDSNVKLIKENMELRAELAACRKDAERYQWISERLLGADFDWNDSGECALIFSFPPDIGIGGNCDMNIDAAMSHKEGGE